MESFPTGEIQRRDCLISPKEINGRRRLKSCVSSLRTSISKPDFFVDYFLTHEWDFMMLKVKDFYPRRRRFRVKRLLVMPLKSCCRLKTRPASASVPTKFKPFPPRGPAFEEVYSNKQLVRLIRHTATSVRTPFYRFGRSSVIVSCGFLVGDLKHLLRRPHHPGHFLLLKDVPDEALPLPLINDDIKLSDYGFKWGDTISIALWEFFPLPVWDMHENGYIVVRASLYYTLSMLKIIIEKRSGYPPNMQKLFYNNISLDGKDEQTLQSLGIASTRKQWDQLTLLPLHLFPEQSHDVLHIRPRLISYPAVLTSRPYVDKTITVDHFMRFVLGVNEGHLKFNDEVLEGSRCLVDYGIDDESTIFLYRSLSPCEDVIIKTPSAASLLKSMDLMTALRFVIKKSLAQDGLICGFREGTEAIKKHTAQLCILAEDWKHADNVKLVKTLCADHNVHLVTVPSAKSLSLWAGLYELDSEGKAINVVGCSCVVVKDYGEESESLHMVQEYAKSHRDMLLFAKLSDERSWNDPIRNK